MRLLLEIYFALNLFLTGISFGRHKYFNRTGTLDSVYDFVMLSLLALAAAPGIIAIAIFEGIIKFFKS